MERQVDCLRITVLNAGKLLHWRFPTVRAELRLFLNPVSAFFGDCTLSELVAKLDLELCAVEASLSFKLGDEELPSLFLYLVSNLLWNKRWAREDEL